MSQNVSGVMSFTDITKENVSKILRDLELQTPMHFQIYSDMYKEYLHMLDNMFGLFIHAEKEIIEDPGITDPKMVQVFDRMTRATTDQWLTYLDNYGEFLQLYAKTRTESTKAYDKYMHDMINAWTRMLEGSFKWTRSSNNNNNNSKKEEEEEKIRNEA